MFKNLVVRTPALVVSFSTMGKLEEAGTGTGMEYYAEILRDLCKTKSMQAKTRKQLKDMIVQVLQSKS